MKVNSNFPIMCMATKEVTLPDVWLCLTAYRLKCIKLNFSGLLSYAVFGRETDQGICENTTIMRGERVE